MKHFQLLLFFICLPYLGFAQDNEETSESEVIKGVVLNDATDQALENVNIVNLNQVIGTTTNKDGEFQLRAAVNDTLYFSYLGFKVKMTELGIALEEVVLKPVQLTGYVEVDAKIIPVYDDYRYRIAGIGGGYEGGKKQPGAVSKVLSSIFNPADFLYNVFGKRPKQMRKLRKMKEDDEIRNLLQSKFDRETLMAVLQLEKVDIDEILNNCNYSENFIKTANDLQILDAISECYEEYRVLNREKGKG